MKYKVMFNKN